MSDGVELNVVEAGDRSAPALVIVHGFGGAKEDFTDHLPALAIRHRVIAFDHRGHGESGKPDEEAAYSLDRFGADVVELADALDIGRFRLLGNSMGGMVAQRVVLSVPGRVDALILQDTWPGPVPFDRDLAVRAAEVARSHGLAELQRRSAGRDALETAAHQRLVAERAGYAEFCDRKFLSQSAAMYSAVVVEMFDQDDRTEALAAIDCPTLVVTGEQDPARPGCEQIAQAIPGAQFVVIPDAGHSPQLENPSLWLAAVTRFLDDLSL